MNAQYNSFNVLFCSVGRRVELLRSFRRAYDALGLTGKIIAVDIDPLAPALQVADVCYIVPRLQSTEYIPTLTRICRHEEVRLIFPLIDPDIPLLAQNRRSLEETGARLAVIPVDSTEIVEDKWATFQFFQRLGLPIPATWLPTDPAVLQQ